MRRPYLQGHWVDAIQKLSEKPDFTLDSLELENPWECDNKYHGGEVLIPAAIEMSCRMLG